jgi:hypothetical protein
MTTVKDSSELIIKIKNFLDTICEDGKFVDENGRIVSLIISSVDDKATSMNVSASSLGVAMTIFNLFENLKSDREKQAIILKLIAMDRNIVDMPDPTAPTANA